MCFFFLCLCGWLSMCLLPRAFKLLSLRMDSFIFLRCSLSNRNRTYGTHDDNEDGKKYVKPSMSTIYIDSSIDYYHQLSVEKAIYIQPTQQKIALTINLKYSDCMRKKLLFMGKFISKLIVINVFQIGFCCFF